jgi:hypothetical protein
MLPREYLVAERTLMGAVDSFLKSIVHVRPQLVKRFEKISGAWIEVWLEEGGENMLEAVYPAWLANYLAQLEAQSSEERVEAERFFQIFYTWAVQEKLIDASPITFSSISASPTCASSVSASPIR